MLNELLNGMQKEKCIMARKATINTLRSSLKSIAMASGIVEKRINNTQ